MCKNTLKNAYSFGEPNANRLFKNTSQAKNASKANNTLNLPQIYSIQPFKQCYVQ